MEGGRLVPPGSLAGARARLEQLAAELGRIDAQRLDPSRALRAGYDEWADKARRAERYLREEEQALAAWVADRETEREAEDQEFMEFWR